MREKPRRLFLFETFGEGVVRAAAARGEPITICSLCGNYVSVRGYMFNDCIHCGMGIDFEDEVKAIEDEDGYEIGIKLRRQPSQKVMQRRYEAYLGYLKENDLLIPPESLLS
jgi:hypothetical protein